MAAWQKPGWVGADQVSHEPGIPETHCSRSWKKQTHSINKSMHLTMRSKLEEVQDTVHREILVVPLPHARHPARIY